MFMYKLISVIKKHCKRYNVKKKKCYEVIYLRHYIIMLLFCFLIFKPSSFQYIITKKNLELPQKTPSIKYISLVITKHNNTNF